MTAEERESLFEQMLELPENLKNKLLIDAFARMEIIQDEPNYSVHHSGTFFERVAYVNDQYLEGKLG